MESSCESSFSTTALLHNNLNMEWFHINRDWMYDRCYRGRRGLKESFVNGVEEFVVKACQQETYIKERQTRCPCNKCHSTRILPIEMVKLHLYKNGFMPDYYVWIDHGEQLPSVNDNRIRKASGQLVNERSKRTQSKRTHEEFESRFSPARSETASCSGQPESSPIDLAKEERIRSESWFLAAGGKKKRRIYGVGEGAHIKYGDKLMYHGSSSPSYCSQKIQLEQEFENCRADVERLNRQLQTLVSVVLPFLPPDAQTTLKQQFQLQKEQH